MMNDNEATLEMNRICREAEEDCDLAFELARAFGDFVLEHPIATPVAA